MKPEIKVIRTYRNEQGAQFQVLYVPVFYVDNNPFNKEWPVTDVQLRDMLKDKRSSFSGFHKMVVV